MSRNPLTANDWNPLATRVNTIPNKGNGIGVKKFKLTSEQQNGMLLLQTPKMHTWGIQEYVDKKTNVGDGKFKLSLNFPIEETSETNAFKEKLATFYEKIIDIIETNSPSFYGKKKSRDVIAETSYPILKYSKIKESLELDYSKPPSISIKVDNKYDQQKNAYTDELDVKVYDKSRNLVYPNENPDDVPMNYVTKQSVVVAIIKCNSIWIGASNWGITFSAVQIVVISQGDTLNSSVCQIKLGDDDEDDDAPPIKPIVKSILQKPVVTSTFNVAPKSDTFIEDEEDDVVPTPAPTKESKESLPTTNVQDNEDDSDNEDEEPAPVKAPVVVEAPKRVVKKVIKK